MPKISLLSNRIFLLILGAALIFFAGKGLIVYAHCAALDKCVWLNDFWVAYHPAQALVSGDLRAIYDTGPIVQWIDSGGKNGEFHPTLYPPYSLFLMYPLGLAEPIAGAILWMTAHTMLLIWVLHRQGAHTLFAGISGPYIYILFVPSYMLTLFYGQTGILCTALFLLVVFWRKTHPVLAGVAFSILCFKPQMALALAILLLQERNRTSLVTIVLCLGTATLASIGIWGMALWLDYIKMATLSSMVLSFASAQYLKVMSSSYMAVQMVGGSSDLAKILQLTLSGGVAITLWQALKRSTDDAQRLLLLVPATFLLSPYSFVYDMILLTPVCALLAASIMSKTATVFSYILLVLLAFTPIIAIGVQHMLHIPYTALVIFFAYGFAVHNVYACKNVSICPK